MKEQSHISQEEFELIEQYLSNDLPAAEAAIFKTRLLTDDTWRQKTEEMRLLILGINESALEERLNKYHAGITNTSASSGSTGKLIGFSRKWLAAASVVLMVSLATWLIVTKESKEEKLYAAYFRPDPGLLTAMGSSDDYSFEKAMVEYKEGNFKKAIDAWSKLRAAAPQSDTLNYFLGVANMAATNDKAAQEFLSIITSDSNKVFYKDACWYLGLTLLKNGELTKAAEWIQKSGHAESDKLIDAINNK